MKGTVTEINSARGMVAVSTEEGFSIFELSGDEVQVGDVVSWSATRPFGSETITNHTQGNRVEVYFQNHWVTPEQLRAQLRY